MLKSAAELGLGKHCCKNMSVSHLVSTVGSCHADQEDKRTGTFWLQRPLAVEHQGIALLETAVTDTWFCFPCPCIFFLLASATEP